MEVAGPINQMEEENLRPIPKASPVIRLGSRRGVTRFSVPDVSTSSRSDSKSSRSSRKFIQVLESSQQFARSTRLNMFGALNDLSEKVRSSLRLTPIMRPVPPPLSFENYLNHLDYNGRVISIRKYRHDIFTNGFDPHVRIDIWRVILGVFPRNASIYVRDQFLSGLSEDYYRLKIEWLLLLQSGKLPADAVQTFALIRGDVDRTDRALPLYSGPEGAAWTRQLYELLCMFVFCHPSVPYRQGMADFASAILYVQRDEAKAYMCFCALMSRLVTTFNDPSIIMQQMDHIQQLLAFVDPPFHSLVSLHKTELLFGPLYRWLMLELKREFDFDSAMRILELQWVMARLPQTNYPGVRLTDDTFEAANPESKQTQVRSWLLEQEGSPGTQTPPQFASNMVGSWLSVLSSVPTVSEQQTTKDESEKLSGSSSKEDGPTPGEILTSSNVVRRSKVGGFRGMLTQSDRHSENQQTKKTRNFRVSTLPAFNELGAGNPFLVFLCTSLLLEYREQLLDSKMDALASFTLLFKAGRVHNKDSVVSRAYYLFKLYLHEMRRCQSDVSGLEDFM